MYAMLYNYDFCTHACAHSFGPSIGLYAYSECTWFFEERYVSYNDPYISMLSRLYRWIMHFVGLYEHMEEVVDWLQRDVSTQEYESDYMYVLLRRMFSAARAQFLVYAYISNIIFSFPPPPQLLPSCLNLLLCTP